MALKFEIATQVATVDVKSFAAHVDFTTDPILWNSISGFSLNVWFNVVVGTIATSKISVEASNTTDVLSFNPYESLTNIALQRIIEQDVVRPKYIRLVYTAGGATAGSLITFNLNEIRI